MSIRFKLILTYFLSVVLSAAIIITVFVGMLASVIGYLFTTLMNNNDPAIVIENLMNIVVNIKQAEEYSPELLMDSEFISDIDERLNLLEAGLVVEYGTTYVSSSYLPDEAGFYELLVPVDYESIHNGNANEKEVMNIEYDDIGYVYFDMINNYNNQEVTYYFVMDSSRFQRTGDRAIGFFIVVLLVLLLVIMSPILILINKDIIKPLRELEKGANKISSGELDFQLQVGSYNEVGRVTHAFERMRQELKSSIEQQIKYENNRKELISSISHDLKTPMTSIKGYIEGIQDGVANTEEKMERYLKVIYDKSVDMDRMIDDLFLFSKLDLERLNFNYMDMNVVGFTEDMVEEMTLDYKEVLSIEYMNHDVDMNILMHIDPQQFKRVVYNIVQNAIKYNVKETKKLRITIKQKDEKICFSFSDNGIGMTKDQVDKAFEMFYRGDESRNAPASGSGLGLAIVKQIITQMEGSVTIKSQLDRGTEIIVCMPLKKNLL